MKLKNCSFEQFFNEWTNRKPGSVLFGHLSSPQVALRIERLNNSRSEQLLIDCFLAASRVYLSSVSPRKTVGFYL